MRSSIPTSSSISFPIVTLSIVALSIGLAACAGDDSSPAVDTTGAEPTETGTDPTTAAGTTGDDTSSLPTEGPLGCPAGESCTLVVVAQAFDDRVEVYAPRGAGPVYRGAIDLDLKPNPMGDNSGDFLDEPYGMVIDDAGLTVSVGHYPQRDDGSFLVFPHEYLAGKTVGATVPVADFFDGSSFLAPVRAIDADATEAIFMLAHPSGRQLVGVFSNDLFALETDWTNPGEVLVLDPATGEVGRRSLASLGMGSCLGAWGITQIDADHVALGCDGDEGAAVLDISAVGEGSVADAAAALDGCVADVFFPDKRVRYLAPDGLGGFLLAENTPIATFEPGRLWRFDGECNQLGTMPGEIPGELWEVREIVALPSDVGARWLMATGRTEGRGIHVVRDGETGAEICNTLTDLGEWWTGKDDNPVHPYAMGLDRAGTGLAIGAGPPEPADDAPGYGRVLWVELGGGDPCEASPVQSVVDLTDDAPQVTEDDPATWRRGPNVVLVKDHG